VISELFTPAVLIGIVTSGIRLATPYLYATVGETFGQLSGVLNLGVEGMMLMGAYSGFYVTFKTGDPWLGLLAAIIVGAMMGVAMAFISVTLQAEQGISGIGVYLFGLGMSELLFQKTLGTVETVSGFPTLRIPWLADVPVIGGIFFNNNVLVYGAYLLVPLSWFILHRTTWGLQIKAVGQNPAAADSLGVSVARVRYLTVTVGGVLSSVAGASLSIALLNVFQQNLTSGMGFIAVALVYFGGWSPIGALAGSLLFSSVNALQNWVQVLGLPVPPDFAVMMPYVLTILILVVALRKVRQPAALTKPFERGEG
jgi:simple sugar transport system permease protein